MSDQSQAIPRDRDQPIVLGVFLIYNFIRYPGCNNFPSKRAPSTLLKQSFIRL